MKKHLGNAICAAREAEGLKQEELGAMLGISKQAVSKTEIGERDLKAEELLSLAKLLGNQFENIIETVLSEIVADLATRLREFLGRTKFAPDQHGKRDWLRSVLAELDETHVTGAA